MKKIGKKKARAQRTRSILGETPRRALRDVLNVETATCERLTQAMVEADAELDNLPPSRQARIAVRIAERARRAQEEFHLRGCSGIMRMSCRELEDTLVGTDEAIEREGDTLRLRARIRGAQTEYDYRCSR